MNKIWFTGDTHFGHERTLQLSKRPFDTVREMDMAMAGKWNMKVAPDDIVYHIGDFGDYKQSFLLNGRINLLVGNYERNDLENGIITLDSLRNNYNFNTVSQLDQLIIEVNNDKFCLTHEPSNRAFNMFSLFGHIHKLQMVKKNALNVGVDCHNFSPIDLETVLFYKNAIENHYDEEVFMD